MADLRIAYDEEMVGAGHPTKEDTLNRLVLAEHNSDGTHKNASPGLLLGLGCEYASASSVLLKPGGLEMGGVLYRAETAITLGGLGGLSADTWYYLMATPPATGSELSASEISLQAGAPAFDGAKNGWYSGSARCLGCLLTDGSGGVLEFFTSGGWWVPNVPLLVVNGAPGSGWTSVNANLPALGRLLLALTADHDRSGGVAALELRPGGSSHTGHPLIYVTRDNGYDRGDGSAMSLSDAGGNLDYNIANCTSLKLAWFALQLPRGLRGQ
ncbi:MAG: hypothetical protein KQH53_11320 [Desulfarculaceae bacterium]|nr:hypothetical protein [Desulfarculaceae bacterium]